MNRNARSLLSFVVLALALPSAARGVEVEVAFSPSLRANLARIDEVEQVAEQQFRAHRAYDDFSRSNRVVSASAVLANVGWANERLVQSAAGYGVESLVRALVIDGLAKAGVADVPRIRVTVDRIGVRNHPVAPLRGNNNYVNGTFELLDASGAVLRSVDVVSNLVASPTSDRSYRGPDYAFDDMDPSRRVGPSLAYFVTKGLKRLYPDKTFPKVVTVLFGDRDTSDRPTLVRVP